MKKQKSVSLGGVFVSKRSKYSANEKYQILMEYMNRGKNIGSLTKEYKISRSTLYSWKDKFELYGIDGLKESHGWKNYSNELKLSAVQDYLSGNYSQLEICRKYKASHGALEVWIKNYNSHKEIKDTHRRKSLMTQSRKLSFEEKIEAVHFCIKNDHNYSLVVEKYQINYQRIYSWTKKYEANGPEVLRDHRGRNKSIEEMTDEEKIRIKVKELEAKNYQLEMENALLKKVEEIERRGF